MKSTVIGPCARCGAPVYANVSGRLRTKPPLHKACADAYHRSERRQRQGICVMCDAPAHQGACEVGARRMPSGRK